MEMIGLLVGFFCLGLIEVIIRWLNPPLKPPEDEWENGRSYEAINALF